MIKYDPAKLNDVMDVCNTLNTNFKFVRYSCDAETGCVVAQLDTVFTPESAGTVCSAPVQLMVALLDDAYPQLAPFAAAE